MLQRYSEFEFEFVAKTQFLSFSDFFKIEITNNI